MFKFIRKTTINTRAITGTIYNQLILKKGDGENRCFF